MRRCHSEAMSDYRRENNREMWDRPGVLDMVGWPGAPDRKTLAVQNREARLRQAVRIYIEEAGIGD